MRKGKPAFLNFTMLVFGLACLVAGVSAAAAQEDKEPATLDRVMAALERIERNQEALDHRLDVLEKMIDDVFWFEVLGDTAVIEKVRHTGPPSHFEPNPTAQGAGNPLRFYSYIFYPKGLDKSKKYPLLVFPHGGVHANFSSYYRYIVKELLLQGYVIIATEYRGSTGYGGGYYREIDYGGLETEDVYAGRQYMIENYSFVDTNRIGILGWSHGGLITLFNIFDHPKDYQCAFAGVPVSDLIARMGYKTQGYRDLYSARYHIGKTAYEDVDEYRRRSPAWNAERMGDTPLLIHTNTSDEDVNVLEVEHLIKALKAADKKFEYEIFQDLPGGHSFDRLDTKTAREIRLKIYKFLARYLNPSKPFNSLKDFPVGAY
jgi:dipeptidyl aminopeptidase/acylaminoacyl peptidase